MLKKRPEITNKTFHFKKLERKMQTKSKTSKRKAVRAETNQRNNFKKKIQ